MRLLRVLLRVLLRLLLLPLLARALLRAMRLQEAPPAWEMPHRLAKVLRESRFRPLMPASAAGGRGEGVWQQQRQQFEQQ